MYNKNDTCMCTGTVYVLRDAESCLQILLFSATIGDDQTDPDDLKLRNMIEQCVGKVHCVAKAESKDVAGMSHVFIKCENDEEKIKVLCWLLCDPVSVALVCLLSLEFSIHSVPLHPEEGRPVQDQGALVASRSGEFCGCVLTVFHVSEPLRPCCCPSLDVQPA